MGLMAFSLFRPLTHLLYQHTHSTVSPYGRLSKGHREFSDYCLEGTAQALATKFPGHAVWVVLPKTHVHGALASYDNFGKTDWASGGAVLECECDQFC